MQSRIWTFSRNEKGATMFEYAILVGLIALIAIGGVALFGSNLHTMFDNLASQVSSTNQSATQN